MVDRLAVHATGVQQMMAAPVARGVVYRRRQITAQNLYRLFLTDPDAVKVELNFPALEAEGVAADVTVEDLDWACRHSCVRAIRSPAASGRWICTSCRRARPPRRC